MKKIELQNLHEEGDLSIIKRSFKELISGTRDRVSYSMRDTVKEAWEEYLCHNVVEAILLCYEVEQGYEPTGETSLQKFCRKELKKMLRKGKIESFVNMVQPENQGSYVLNKNSRGIYTPEHIHGYYGIVGAIYMKKETAKQICKVLN